MKATDFDETEREAENQNVELNIEFSSFSLSTRSSTISSVFMLGPSARALDAGGECSTGKGCGGCQNTWAMDKGDTHAAVGARKDRTDSDNKQVGFRVLYAMHH
jgi:hypothetical protein